MTGKLDFRKYQLDALTKSIEEKWQPICNGARIYRDNTSNCECCREYFHGSDTCYGCPIAEYTGEALCGGLPPFLRENKNSAPRVTNHPMDVAVLNKLKEIQQWLESEIATYE